MCGIAGIWNRDGRPVDPAALRRMGALLRHRGPDGEGLHADGAFGLVHRRLKIIDLTDDAAQPMATPERDLWLVFNGEIHNYLELRADLEQHGHRFRSHSDTEVALLAFRHWGLDCFDRFNGMWAMAFWEPGARRLTLSRDRFGIKPLWYSVLGSRIAFASEAKAILAVYPEERRIQFGEFSSYLTGAFPDAGAASPFANVPAVPPAECLVFDEARCATTRYWRFRPGREEAQPDAARTFHDLLADATRLRMRSDVPVGLSLSGGLDSSAVARLAARFTTSPIECFSLKYEDHPRHDESDYAAAAADDPASYTLHWIRPDPRNLFDTMREIVWHHDTPAAARGRYASWFVLREARRHVTVLLDGQGSDEMLAGYSRFVTTYLIDRLTGRYGRPEGQPLWRSLRELSTVAASSVWAWREIASGALFRKLGVPPWIGARVFGPSYPAAEADPLAQPEAWPVRRFPRPYRSRLNNALWHEFTYAGLGETLRGHDALAMAHSLENRSPFLDHRLVEFCFTLPADEKIRDGWTKSLLRRALTDVLPPTIRDRRRKLGFPIPLDAWLRLPDNQRALRELVLDGALARDGLFDRRKLERLLDAFRRPRQSLPRIRWPRAPNMEAVWRWACAEIWYRDFILRCPSESPSADAATARALQEAHTV